MSRTKSSSRWLQEHFSDTYVKQAKAAGYRSRAAFKLLELQEKDKLFKPGMTIVDLGAAPGGWSQVVANLSWIPTSTGMTRGKIIAMDLLPMDPIAGVTFIQGDFLDPDVLSQLQNLLTQPVDWVISDMAPNLSGIASADQARSVYLVECAIDFAQKTLKPGGGFLAKGFQGAGFDEIVKLLRSCFTKVVIRKPDASRARSSELYFLARGFK